MSNKPQTAVERFFMALQIRGLLPNDDILKCYEEAKEIEKEQNKHRAIESHYLYSQYLDQRPKIGGATVEMDFEQWYECKFQKTP